MEDESYLLSILRMSAEELQAIREAAARELKIEMEVRRQMGDLSDDPPMSWAEIRRAMEKRDAELGFDGDIDIMEILRQADEEGGGPNVPG